MREKPNLYIWICWYVLAAYLTFVLDYGFSWQIKVTVWREPPQITAGGRVPDEHVWIRHKKYYRQAIACGALWPVCLPIIVLFAYKLGINLYIAFTVPYGYQPKIDEPGDVLFLDKT